MLRAGAGCREKIQMAVKAMVVIVFTAGMLKAITFDRMAKMGGSGNYVHFGTSVSSAGDVNGDGYDDLIVGCTGCGPNSGMAFIYFGGPLMDTIPDVKLVGEATGDYFGTSVSSAGDVNGDGYDDVIVGADDNDFNGNSSAGAAYIYFGGPSMDSIPDVKMGGDTVYAYFGSSVSSVGDVNGDGFDDVIVGAPYRDFGGIQRAGAAYIFYGGVSMDSIPDVVMGGKESDERFAYSVSFAGDVNGDGYDDVIIGAYNDNFDGNFDAGAAYIFYGGASMDSIYDIIMGGEAREDFFGTSVSSAGDVNGDGYDDVIVGAYNNDFGGNADAGAAYIFYGGSSMDSIYDIKMGGEASDNYFGYSVSFAGDMNGDGYNDVIVGAPLYDYMGSTDVGAVYVFYGGWSIDSLYDAKMVGEMEGAQLGDAISSAGDLNADGYNDVVGGANWENYGGNTGSGAAYIYDFFMFKHITPNGGETWNVGANETITWEGKDEADLYISTDGGNTWNEIATYLQPPVDTNYNTYTFRVPHIPTRYAMVEVVASGYSPDRTNMSARSDSFFTIKSTVNLLKFEANNSDDNSSVNLTWQTDPGLDVLSGYNLYRIRTNGTKEKINTDLIRATTYKDTKSSEVTGYELGAVNGLGEEYRIGEVEFYTLKKPLEVSPQIAKDNLTIRFIVPDNYLERTREVSVNIVNTTGRVVKRVFSGRMESGAHRISLHNIILPQGSYICVVNIGGKKAYTERFQIMR